MNNRLQQFLELENITPARLADTLGVQRSGLSHILSGRNKPGFEFLTKLLTKFPHINSEWLLMGKGKPYKDAGGENFQSPPLPPFGNSQANKYNNIPYNSVQYNNVQNTNIPYNGIQYATDAILDQNEASDLEQEDTPTLFSHNETIDIEGVALNNEHSELPENCVKGQNKPVGGKKKCIKRVIVFYSDGSFEELFPHIG